MTTNNNDGSEETMKFEYDKQNRIVKIHSTYNYDYGSGRDTKMLHYSGNKLVKRTDEEDSESDENYVIEGDKIAISIPNYYDAELTVNKDGYIMKYSSDNGNISYHYQDGNLIKTIEDDFSNGEKVASYVNEYKYDDKNSPFLNCKTPLWFLQYYFHHNANNFTADVGVKGRMKRTAVYEYDSEGFPNKQMMSEENDGKTYTTTTTFTYRGKAGE
jgi:hypothetical protein